MAWPGIQPKAGKVPATDADGLVLLNQQRKGRAYGEIATAELLAVRISLSLEPNQACDPGKARQPARGPACFVGLSRLLERSSSLQLAHAPRRRLLDIVRGRMADGPRKECETCSGAALQC